MRTRLADALIVLIVLVAGCVSIPQEPTTAAIGSDELSSHVAFLASPALKGRQPRTAGSRHARRYIASRFAACGLEPRPGTDRYEQDFIAGVNMVGVLPGGDPAVADEFVILGAHYDHLGQTEDGLHLGAADNASGVAVLLEVAEQLALSPDKPRRSVVFIAFDAEEAGLLGSFAFTAREDFDPLRLAGVVNLDTLGRDTFDVVDDTLLAIGTGRYPALRSSVIEAGHRAGMRVLPVSRTLVGPRSDHVAFEPYAKPWVFFTAGPYRDYHDPEDTPDKLNPEAMRRAADVVADTVLALADADTVEPPVARSGGDRAELEAIAALLGEVLEQSDRANLTGQQSEQVEVIVAETRRLAAQPTHTEAEHRRLLKSLIDPLTPAVLGYEPSREELILNGYVDSVYTRYPEVYVEMLRDVMFRIIEHKASPLTVPEDYQRVELLVDERSVLLEPVDDGRWRLSVCAPKIDVTVRFKVFGQIEGGLSSTAIFAGITGSREEVVDYGLLKWRGMRDDERLSAGWRRIMQRVTGEDHGTTFEDWRAWRMREGGFSTEADWLLTVLQIDHPRLQNRAVFPAMSSGDERCRDAVRAILADDGRDPDLRDFAIWAVFHHGETEDWLLLADLVTDRTVADSFRLEPAFDETFPFYDDGFTEGFRYTHGPVGTHTLGSIAQSRLKALTGQDFGGDAEAWREWIEAHRAAESVQP